MPAYFVYMELIPQTQTAIENDSPWITDLKLIEKLANERYPRDLEFSHFLKTLNAEEVDKIVIELSQSVEKEIDCKSCANCCKSLMVAPNYPDISKLAEAVNLETNEFKKKYMKRDFEGDMCFKQKPCPFLKNNLCSVYENRPTTCRTYPHLQKGNFIARLGNVLSNLKVCPIAFNTFELLKLRYK